MILPCPRTYLRILSHETGSAVPSRASLLILHTQAESGAYSRDSSRFPRRRPFIYLNRQKPSGQSRVYRVTQLRTNGVHCQESAGTGPVVLKLVAVAGAAILQVIMDQLMCAGRPGSSEVTSQPSGTLGREFDPGNEWRTIKSLVHKIRLNDHRGKGMAESFLREKLRHAPQKKGG